MKVKDVKWFPEAKEILPTTDYRLGHKTRDFLIGYNHALEEIGNLELDLRELIDEEKLIKKINEILTPKYPLLNDTRTDKIIEAIKDQANELVKD